MTKRTPNIFFLILFVVGGSFAINTYSPVLDDIAESMGISEVAAQYLLSLGLFAYAIVQLITGYLISQFGIKRTAISSLLLTIVASLTCYYAGANGKETLLFIATFLMVLGSSAGLAIGVGTIHGVWDEVEARKRTGYAWILFGIFTCLGAYFGSIVATYFSWWDIYFIVTGYAVVFFLFFPLWSQGLPEHKPKHIKHVFRGIIKNFTAIRVWLAAFFWTIAILPIYNFAHLGPYLAEQDLGMSLSTYGAYFFTLSLPMVIGGILGIYLSGRVSSTKGIVIGGIITLVGFIFFALAPEALGWIFGSMYLIQFGSVILTTNAISYGTKAGPDPKSISGVVGFITILLVIISLILTAPFHAQPLYGLKLLFEYAAVILLILGIIVVAIKRP